MGVVDDGNTVFAEFIEAFAPILRADEWCGAYESITGRETGLET